MSNNEVMPKEHFHGSDLEKIEARYGISKDEIVQFGANVNPLGLSDRLKASLGEHLDVITGYPDREYTALRETIAEYCGCDKDHILVGNGSTELISLCIQSLSPRKAVVISPAYSEYEHELMICESRVTYYQLKEEDSFQLDPDDFLRALGNDIDMCIICNPNNPTSTSICHEQMLPILKHCHQNNIFVMIDETYVEFTENYEEVTAVPFTNDFTNLIVLRGISKFFAAPGLRLGYGITSAPSLRAAITRNQKAWSINSLAEVAARLMLTDCDYIKATRDLIFAERTRMVARLQQIPGVKVYLPTANFVLLRIMKEGKDAAGLFDLCIREKLMIRDCSTFTYLDDKYFRFCFMMPEQNEALLQCIEKYFTEK